MVHSKSSLLYGSIKQFRSFNAIVWKNIIQDYIRNENFNNGSVQIFDCFRKKNYIHNIIHDRITKECFLTDLYSTFLLS